MPGTKPFLFDRYVVVDWSARNAPTTGADSIWIDELHRPAVIAEEGWVLGVD